VTAKERYVVAKLLAKELDESPPVARFLGPHAVEDCRRSRKVLTETLGEVGIDSLVFFFQRYGKSENFTLGKAIEIAHTRV
jgi:hypothetical protein